LPKALGVAEALLARFKNDIASLELIPSGGGVFEFFVEGELVYSKKATGRHADPAFLVEEVAKRL
jgi:selenoprotein W-related protein